MTAIIRIYLGPMEGFVTVADGRMTAEDRRTVISDSTQKIFPLVCADAALALSLIGGTELDGIDAKQLIVSAVDGVTHLHVGGLQTLANLLINPLIAAVGGRQMSPDAGQLDEEKPGRTLLEVLVDGYVRDYPVMATIRVYHVDGQIQPPGIVSFHLFDPGVPLIYGPEGLTRHLYLGSTPVISRYVRPLPISDRGAAIDLAQAYIDACSDEELMALDEKCIGVGGHVHAATVTKEGFRWIGGYEPKQR
jgi:hypothetical protein